MAFYIIVYWAPLHYACLYGRKEAVKTLIEQHADVDMMTQGVSYIYLYYYRSFIFLLTESSFFCIMEFYFIFYGVDPEFEIVSFILCLSSSFFSFIMFYFFNLSWFFYFIYA